MGSYNRFCKRLSGHANATGSPSTTTTSHLSKKLYIIVKWEKSVHGISHGSSVTSRALSLRNLVSGYECGRVFPAGVGPGSPSRDAANWLPSRSDLSVEMRRQYGWLRMVFSGVRLFRAPTWWPSGGWRHARGREHCRGEPGGSLSGGYAPDSAKAEGSSIVDEPGEG